MLYISGYKYLICDHMRAVQLYISALEDSCPLMAFPCSSHQDFLDAKCLDCSDPFQLSCPRIGKVPTRDLHWQRENKSLQVLSGFGVCESMKDPGDPCQTSDSMALPIRTKNASDRQY